MAATLPPRSWAALGGEASLSKGEGSRLLFSPCRSQYPLFTRVRGRLILRTSPKRSSTKFARTEYGELRIMGALLVSHLTKKEPDLPIWARQANQAARRLNLRVEANKPAYSLATFPIL